MGLKTRTSSFDRGLPDWRGLLSFRLPQPGSLWIDLEAVVGLDASITGYCKSGGEIICGQRRSPLTRLGQVVNSSLYGDEPAIDVSMKDIVSVWDRRLEVPRTWRSLRQRGGARKSALAICCHDRPPRSPTVGGIASPAAVLLDETGSAEVVHLSRIGSLIFPTSWRRSAAATRPSRCRMDAATKSHTPAAVSIRASSRRRACVPATSMFRTCTSTSLKRRAGTSTEIEKGDGRYQRG